MKTSPTIAITLAILALAGCCGLDINVQAIEADTANYEAARAWRDAALENEGLTADEASEFDILLDGWRARLDSERETAKLDPITDPAIKEEAPADDETVVEEGTG